MKLKMRKVRQIMLMLVCSISSVVFADSVTTNGVTWTYTVSDGEVSMGTGSWNAKAVPDDTIGALEIPSVINGCPVTSIGKYAFCNVSRITNITFPSTVVRIDEYAFYGCAGLTEVMIPTGVMCICEKSFYECKGLKKISIPSSVESIGIEAFAGCISLKSLAIPYGVKEISFDAFSRCSELTSVSIPSSVTHIRGAFSECNMMTKFNVDSSNTSYKSVNGLLLTKDGTELCSGINGDVEIPLGVIKICEKAFSGREELTSVKIPDGVAGLGLLAFSGCKGLKNIYIPSSVEEIGNASFQDCQELAQVEISFGVKRIGSFAFSGCSGLRCITIPSSVTDISDNAFDGCSEVCDVVVPGWKCHINFAVVTNLTISTGTTEIASDAFKNCCGLKSLSIPSGCISIGNSAFSGCSGLMRISIPFDVKYIDAHAFDGCTRINEAVVPGWQCNINFTSVTNLIISEGTTEIKDNAFWGLGGLTTVTIPQSVTHIGDSAFEYCSGLTSISIPLLVTSIGSQLFAGCSALKSVAMHEQITIIGYRAFFGCSSMLNVEFPQSVTNIADEAFYGCDGLKCVKIPSGVLEIGARAFSDCSNLDMFVVDTGNTKYQSANGLLLSKNGEKLHCGINGDVTIPLGVKYICEGAFAGRIGLSGVSIPSGIVDIGDYAFAGCSELKNVVLPTNRFHIGDYAFSDCYGLSSIEVPANVGIGEYAFSECRNIAYVAISNSNEGYGIQDSSFDGCTGIREVVVPGWNCMMDLTSVTNLVISPGTDAIWSKGAFKNCAMLSSVMIPSSVRSVYYDDAFAGCNALTTVYVDKGDSERVRGLYAWPSDVKFVELDTPFVTGDPSAVIYGNFVTGFVVNPSKELTSVEVIIPDNMTESKVSIVLSPKVLEVKPHGAKVKIVNGTSEITQFLNLPEVDANGVIDLTKAMVKDFIVKEAMDPEQGAVIEMNADSPSLTTPNTRKGLVYKLREGSTLKDMQDGDSTIGDGQPWTPTITVKGGTSAFYSISVEK